MRHRLNIITVSLFLTRPQLLRAACVHLLLTVCSFRILELMDTVKLVRSQSSEKDSSLSAMQTSLDRMVGPWEAQLGGGR